MTRVTLYADETDSPRGFAVIGHSGFGSQGNDIVCAAVSVLATNTINAIEAFTDDRPQIERDEEQARMVCRFEHPPGEGSALLLRTFSLGITSIGEQYGKHVRIRKETVRR